jgi:hypothetical protein
MTPEEWESMRERFTKIAMRHENISHCTAIFADQFPQDLVREIEQITKSEGREAIADFCAAFVEDVARGNITYDDIYGNAE